MLKILAFYMNKMYKKTLLIIYHQLLEKTLYFLLLSVHPEKSTTIATR